jgi:hypothetical protein
MNNIQRNFRFIIFIAITLVIVAGITAYLVRAEPLIVLNIPNGAPYRILSEYSANGRWVVNRGNGLILLTHGYRGTWTYTLYNLGNVFDATGPDSNGNLYCSFRGATLSGVYVFNCTSKTVTGTIPLDHIPSGLSLSSNEQILYVCAWGWPEDGGYYNPTDAFLHPNSGILYKIDLSTHQVTSTTIGALPSSIQLINTNRGDRLVISTHETNEFYNIVNGMGFPQGEYDQIDIVDTSSFSRVFQLSVPSSWGDQYCSTMLNWSDDPPLVAVCCPRSDNIDSHPEYANSIWLIDPVSGTVSNTIAITDSQGGPYGALNAVISQENPNEVYVSATGPTSPGNILVIDYSTGDYIRSVDTVVNGLGCIAFFIDELKDGRLMATGPDMGKIIIVDPS